MFPEKSQKGTLSKTHLPELLSDVIRGSIGLLQSLEVR